MKLKLCPLCHTTMAAFSIESLALDGCESCDGVWFDAEELREYGRKMRLGNLPDRASSKPGPSVEGLVCPNCPGSQLAPEDRAHPAIDGCVNCGGLFLGGVEMKKLHRRYMDRVRTEGGDDQVHAGDRARSILDLIRSLFR